MPPRIYSHSVLEAAVCEAKALDAMKPRYGKEGPARQGQAGHRVGELYMTHLNKEGRDSDFEAGARFWSSVKSQLSAADAAAIEDSMYSFVMENTYPWVVGAQQLNTEAVRFFTVPDRREVPVDKVHLLSGPVFRITADMSWTGSPPIPLIGGDHVTHHMLDWKFHRVVEHVNAPHRNRQLLRYSAALYGPECGDTGAFLGYGRKSYYEGTVFTAADRAEAWQTHVVGAIARMEAMLDHPPAEPGRTVGSHCRKCDLFNSCDAAMRYPYVAPWMLTATDEEKMVGVQLAKKLAADLSKELKLRVNEVGPIDDGEDEAVVEETEQMAMPRDDVLAVLQGKVPPQLLDKAFMVSKTRLVKVMTAAKIKPAARADILDELRLTAERKLISTLKVRTKKDERGPSEDTDLSPDTEGTA